MKNSKIVHLDVERLRNVDQDTPLFCWSVNSQRYWYLVVVRNPLGNVDLQKTRAVSIDGIWVPFIVLVQAAALVGIPKRVVALDCLLKELFPSYRGYLLWGRLRRNTWEQLLVIGADSYFHD